MIYSTIKNPVKTSLDVLIGSLCFACFWMSATCGSQCLVSLIYDYFYGGEIACQLEAFFHISAIVAQFFHVTGIAIHGKIILLTRNRPISVRHTTYIVIGIWAMCTIVTYLLSLISPIYLMGGLYCFFSFSSASIAYWLLPCLILSIFTIVCIYGSMVLVAKWSEDSTESLRTHKHATKSSDTHKSSGIKANEKQQYVQTISEKRDVKRFTFIDNKQPIVNDYSKPNPVTATTVATIAVNVINTNSNAIHANTTINIQPTPTQAIIRATPIQATTQPTIQIPIQQPMIDTSRPLTNDNAPTIVGDSLSMRAAKRSAIFVCVLALWTPAAVASIWELWIGKTPTWLVIFVGVGGVTHSNAVPLTYAYTNKYHLETLKSFLGLLFYPCIYIQRRHDERQYSTNNSNNSTESLDSIRSNGSNNESQPKRHGEEEMIEGDGVVNIQGNTQGNIQGDIQVQGVSSSYVKPSSPAPVPITHSPSTIQSRQDSPLIRSSPIWTTLNNNMTIIDVLSTMNHASDTTKSSARLQTTYQMDTPRTLVNNLKPMKTSRSVNMSKQQNVNTSPKRLQVAIGNIVSTMVTPRTPNSGTNVHIL